MRGTVSYFIGQCSFSCSICGNVRRLVSWCQRVSKSVKCFKSVCNEYFTRYYTILNLFMHIMQLATSCNSTSLPDKVCWSVGLLVCLLVMSFKVKMHRNSNGYNTMHRIKCIYYNAYNTTHRKQYILYNR